MPCFLHKFFEAFIEAFCVWCCYVVSSVVRLGLVVCHIFLLVFVTFGWTEALIFFFILFKTHLGYLHVVRAFCRCSCSSSCCSLVEHTSLVLWNNVLMTLYLTDMAWCLSHCKYWLEWIGFLHTVVSKSPSACGVTRVSRKSMEPSALVFSAVNWIPSSIEFICVKISSLWADFMTTKVSSTNLFQRLGGVVLPWGLLFQIPL